MCILYCTCKHILQSFGLCLSLDLNVLPSMVHVLVCAWRHTCIVLRQEVPWFLWSLLVSSAGLSCLYSVTKPGGLVGGNACAWYGWQGKEGLLNICSWGTFHKNRTGTECHKPGEVKWGDCYCVCDSFISGFVFMVYLEHLLP